MLVAWKGKRQPKTGVGLKADFVLDDERSSISGAGTATGEARAPAASATERMADVNFMITVMLVE